MHPSSDRRIKKRIGIFFGILLFTILYPLFTFGATLYFYPQNISLVPGEEALIDIRIDTGADTINAVELEGAFSGVAATLRSIDNSGSALDIFVERPSIRGRSDFRLVGGVPSGLFGEHILARLLIRAELAGRTTLSFTPAAAKVLLADGTGSKAPVTFMEAVITVSPKAPDQILISSQSHPDQNQWYAADKAQLQFNFTEGASYSYVVTRDPLQEPDMIPDKPEGTATWRGETKLEELPEGITYFAIRKIGSAAVSRYRLMNDTSEPSWIEVAKNEGTVETEGRPFLTFLAQDAISGVENYEMRIDGGESVIVTSPQPLPDSYRVLSIRAYDRAGNYIEQFIPGPQKDFTLWFWAAILLVLLVWVSGIIKVRK